MVRVYPNCVRDAGVAGSNPATPTIIFSHLAFLTFLQPKK
jgi:hypothetical protein